MRKKSLTFMAIFYIFHKSDIKNFIKLSINKCIRASVNWTLIFIRGVVKADASGTMVMKIYVTLSQGPMNGMLVLPVAQYIGYGARIRS